jgi:hypothetical protein
LFCFFTLHQFVSYYIFIHSFCFYCSSPLPSSHPLHLLLLNLSFISAILCCWSGPPPPPQPVSGHQLGKHVPAATNTYATGFYMWSMPRSYNQDSWSNELVPAWRRFPILPPYPCES